MQFSTNPHIQGDLKIKKVNATEVVVLFYLFIAELSLAFLFKVLTGSNLVFMIISGIFALSNIWVFVKLYQYGKKGHPSYLTSFIAYRFLQKRKVDSYGFDLRSLCKSVDQKNNVL